MPAMAGSRMHLAVRCFATDGAAGRVAEVLKSEREYEAADYTPPEVGPMHTGSAESSADCSTDDTLQGTIINLRLAGLCRGIPFRFLAPSTSCCYQSH